MAKTVYGDWQGVYACECGHCERDPFELQVCKKCGNIGEKDAWAEMKKSAARQVHEEVWYRPGLRCNLRWEVKR